MYETTFFIFAILMGIGAIIFVIYTLIPKNKVNKTVDLLAIKNNSETKIEKPQLLVSIMEKSTNSNEQRIINKNLSDNELKDFQKEGILITKLYSEKKEIPVAGFTKSIQVNIISAVITDDIKLLIVNLSNAEVVIELDDVTCNDMKSCLSNE